MLSKKISGKKSVDKHFCWSRSAIILTIKAVCPALEGILLGALLTTFAPAKESLASL